MPIPLQCDCGRSLRIKDELAGRKVKCPQCAAVLVVPLPEAPAEDEAYELLADDAPEEPRRRKKAEPDNADAMVQTSPRSRRPATEDEDDPERSRRERRRREEEQEEARRRERRRKDVRREEARRERPRVAFEPGWFGSMNSGVAGGLLMIVIAVVWFGLGLMADRIFFYPPILVIIGIGSIIKGLAGR